MWLRRLSSSPPNSTPSSLPGDHATHVADLLAGASIAAQGDIADFGTAFQQVSAVARQADISIETTTGLLIELAKAGLRGADGGTSLRTVMLRLTPTTKQAAEYQKILGVELDQTRTIGEQLPEIIDQYKASLSALTPIQQQQVLTQIFGQDAYRGIAIAIREGSAGLEETTRQADQNGAANRLAQANAKGLSGAFNGLKSNIDTLGITMGEFVKGPLEDIVRGLATVLGGVTTLVSALPALNEALNNFHIRRLARRAATVGDRGFEDIIKQALFFGPESGSGHGVHREDCRTRPGGVVLAEQGLRESVTGEGSSAPRLLGRAGVPNRRSSRSCPT